MNIRAFSYVAALVLIGIGASSAPAEVVIVDCTTSNRTISAPLEAGVQYIVQVEGLYKFSDPDKFADAEYFDWTGTDTWENDPTVHGIPSSQVFDLLINDVDQEWGWDDNGTFRTDVHNPAHVYTLENPIVGDGNPLEFVVYDPNGPSYPDPLPTGLSFSGNSGSMTVTITATSVPAVPQWGMATLVLLIVAAGTIVFRKAGVAG